MYKGDHLKGEIEIINTNNVFHNTFISVYNDVVIFPSGFKGTYLRIEQPTSASVGILPIRDDGRFGLVKNFRHGARGWCLELIKGGVEKTESLLQAAHRELAEEAGLCARQYTLVGSYSDSPAVLSGRLYCFFAHTLSQIGQKKEKTEAISDTMFFNWEEYKKACKEMDFVDGITELLIYKYIFEGGLENV